MSWPKLYDNEGVRDWDYGDKDDNYCSICGPTDSPESERHEHTERRRPLTIHELIDIPFALKDDVNEMHEIQVTEILKDTPKAVLLSGTVEDIELEKRWIPKSQIKISGVNALLVSDWFFTKLQGEG